MRQIVPHFVYFPYSFHSHSPRSPFLSFCHDSMQVNQTTALTLFLGFAWVWFGLFFLCFLNAFAFLGLLHIDFSQFVSLLLLLLLLIFIKLLFTSAPTGTAAFGSLLFWVYFTIMLTANLTHNSASLARHTCGCTQILSYTRTLPHTFTHTLALVALTPSAFKRMSLPAAASRARRIFVAVPVWRLETKWTAVCERDCKRK